MAANEIGDGLPAAAEAGDAIDPKSQRPAKGVEEELIARRRAERPRNEYAPITERPCCDGDARDHEYGFAFDRRRDEHAEVREPVHADLFHL